MNNPTLPHSKPHPMAKKASLNTCTLSHFLQNSDFQQFLTALPSFMSSSLHVSFSVTPSLLSTFLQTLSHLSEHTLKRTLFLFKHICKSKHKLLKDNFLLSTCSFPFSQLLILILSLLHSIQSTNCNIVEFADKKSLSLLQRDMADYIAKLFHSELLSLAEVELLIKFILAINDTSSIKTTVEKGIIASINLFLLILPKLHKANVQSQLKQQFISNYVALLHSKANSSLNFVYALSKTTLLLKLLNAIGDCESAKTEIIALLTFIYAFKLRQTHLSFIYRSMKSHIANVNDVQVDKFVALLKLISNQMSFFTELNAKEKQPKVTYEIESGFVFGEANPDKTDKIGFTYGPVVFPQNKPMVSIMLKFQPFDTASNEYRPIFTMKHNTHQTPKLMLYQHQSSLYVKIFNSEQSSTETPFSSEGSVLIAKTLQPNEPCFVVMSSCVSGVIKKRRSLLCYVNSAKHKKDIPFTLEFPDSNYAVDIDVGHYVHANKRRYAFYGVIGAIEVFNTSIDAKFCEGMDKNVILYTYFIDNSTDKPSDSEVNAYYSCSACQHPSTNHISNLINTYKLADTLVSAISPTTALNPIHKDKKVIPNYTYYNPANTNAKLTFKAVPIPENGLVFPFTKTRRFVDTFMQNEGIDYLVLCFELTYHMHLNLAQQTPQQSTADVYAHIYTVIESVLDFVCKLLEDETYTELSKEKYSRVFFACSKLMFKVSSYVLMFIYVNIARKPQRRSVRCCARPQVGSSEPVASRSAICSTRYT